MIGVRRSVSRSSLALTPPNAPANALATCCGTMLRSAMRARSSDTSTMGWVAANASRTSVSDGTVCMAVRTVSAHRCDSTSVGADSSTRTNRPSRPISEPNSDCPARSMANAPLARSGNFARSCCANWAASALAGTGTMSCAVALEPGSAPARISSSVALPTRA